MFACPFLEGFSEHWVDYTSDFPLLPLPKLQEQGIPNHPKMYPKILFFGKPFHRNNDSSKGWGEHVPALSKHMYLTITGISGTVIIVLSSLLSPTKTSSCSSGPCLHSEGCQMHPAVPCLQTFELLDVILSCFSFLIRPAAPHHCSHSRSEDVSLGSGISLGAPQDTLAGESHGRGRHQCDRESLLLSVTKTPCALPGGNSLVALYRKKLQNSEVMVRKISPSPYFRRHSYLNPPKPATTAREKLHSGTQNPFLAQHC